MTSPTSLALDTIISSLSNLLDVAVEEDNYPLMNYILDSLLGLQRAWLESMGVEVPPPPAEVPDDDDNDDNQNAVPEAPPVIAQYHPSSQVHPIHPLEEPIDWLSVDWSGGQYSLDEDCFV